TSRYVFYHEVMASLSAVSNIGRPQSRDRITRKNSYFFLTVPAIHYSRSSRYCEVASCSLIFPTCPPSMATESMEIDDSLYSRQRYVLGDNAMHQMAQSSVFLSGMGGLGIEIAKNIVLAGVKAVTLHDTKVCETWDLGSNFFIRKDDVSSQKMRVEAVCSRVAELNPYVHVDISSSILDNNTDLRFLQKYQCVILTEATICLQKRVNDFCHSQQPPIKFLSCDAFGVCVRVFCDFGDEFVVSDPTGEEPKEIFIQNITQSNPGVVTCMDNRPHGLQTGQSVVFREVNGMEELNGTVQHVSVLSPHSFAIGDTSQLQPYAHGGFVFLMKTPKTCRFVSWPFATSAPLQIHAAMLMSLFLCSILLISSAVGGLASQEVLKAITGKFAPLQQWFYLDAMEILRPLHSVSPEEFLPRGDRYDGLRACIGESLCQELHKLRVFMVGCGAIGCEMLKNFSLLGVGLSKSSGEVCITDPDLIEKSNLNRQFLFRPHHIQKSKSTTAAEATYDINPDLQVEAHLNKVCPATESIYNDSFFSRMNVVVTALDNVEARRYVDSRCVSNQRPLLDSGTMGTKGHTEIIVPNLTESYNSHRDPPEEEIPFCTLKSFPSVIEHTIQWARDKFENAFVHKPSMYNSFWQNHPSPEVVLQAGESLEGSFQVIKLLNRRPSQWEQCIAVGRLKFEKYFKRKALQLLHSFPLDTRLKDGSLFWQSPKRPPTPVEFDLKDPLRVEGNDEPHAVPHFFWLSQDLSEEVVASILSEVRIPEYSPLDKSVETDETAKKPDLIKMPVNSEEEREAITHLEQAISTCGITSGDALQMNPQQFEKDDDNNGHVDFVASASALRARVYSIEPADRLKTKRIAGKIIPAIATATAAVAGLVALELIKVVGCQEFESFRNCFFNLAIPVVVLTEPAKVKKTMISNIYFSIWDCWTILGHEDFTLSDFMNAVREKYGIEPTMVVHGVKMLYVPVMPGHSKRLKLTMQKLIKPSLDRRYVDLTVSFAPEADDEDDLPGPPVRYYFSSHETP
uniref:Ubiquitin-like modifier-activating enzyme 6 n=1 Tax=Takifugu rubripes TaxID=31033 RepID=A0A674NBJ8_TAKRU